MNRVDREIKNSKEIKQIIKQGKFISLSLCRNNEPYVVTLNYGYNASENALYFHCAEKGLKIDFIADNPNACGAIINDLGYIMGKCSHAYQSVVVHGKMEQLVNIDDKKHAIDVLINHLEKNPDVIKKNTLKDEKKLVNLGILKLNITEMTGKKSS